MGPFSPTFISRILGVNWLALMKLNSVDSILVLFHNINTLAYSFEVFNKCSPTSEFHISSQENQIHMIFILGMSNLWSMGPIHPKTVLNMTNTFVDDRVITQQ